MHFILFCAIVSLYIIVCVVIAICGMKRKGILPEKYKYITDRLSVWLLGCMAWMMIGYFLAAVSLTASFFALLADDYKIFTCIAASTAILSFIVVPQKHSRSYRMAYSLLDNAVNLFNIGKISIEVLMKTIDVCEKTIDWSYDVFSDREYLDCCDELRKYDDSNKL